MTDEKLIIVKTIKDLKALSEYIRDKDILTFDTETTGVEEDSEIIGFSICAELDLAYYVILASWNTETSSLDYLETKDYAAAFFEELLPKRLAMHNAIFDCIRVYNNYRVLLIFSVYMDTMILAHLLDENRRVGLKELGLSIYGSDATKEQADMKASIDRNGGVITKDKYELYKADADLIALYGAKDALLTYGLMLQFTPDLYDQKLDTFFFDEESMPLLRGPTYDLNTTGLRVDMDKLQALKGILEAEILEAKSFIYKEIEAYVKDRYPGTSKAKTFNIGAPQQISWLVFEKLGMEFHVLTDSGKDLCKALDMKLPYTASAKRDFISRIKSMKDHVYAKGAYNPKTKKIGRDKKVGDPWTYLACGKTALAAAAQKYKWAQRLLEYKKNIKLLSTYVEGIQSKARYGIIRPSFLQHGTTSGRYSSRHPNFQNLPRDDKRIKACIVARPGKIFVGADYSQLEPRVFASLSKDERLMKSFKDGDDFYSVIGSEVFGKYDCTLKKDDSPNSFAVKYKKLRDVAKVIALATPYGTCAPQMASELAVKAGLTKSMAECQDIIDDYFANYPSVEKLMLDAHKQVKEHGIVYNLFGRPRRIPEALTIARDYGKNTPHRELPRAARNMLNLSMNHPVQSTGASIMNRASIACWQNCRAMEAIDPAWKEVKIIIQVHDELVLEGPEHLADDMATILKDAMENTVVLPGVDLVAEPVKAYNLADLK